MDGCGKSEIFDRLLNMTNEEIKKLETELCGAADELRANSQH